MNLLKSCAMMIVCLQLAFCTSAQTKKDQENERNPEYQYKKAEVAMKYGLLEESIKYLNQAILLDPNHSKSYYLLGVAYYRIQRLEESASAFQKCLEINPDHPDAHTGLATVYEELGMPDQAETELIKAYTLDNNPNISFILAKLYFNQDKLDRALEYIRKTIEKKSQSAEAYNLEGVILNQMGHYSKAIAGFENALRINPKMIAARINLGVAYINNKEYDKARILLTETLPLTQDQTLKDRINKFLGKIKEY